MPTKRNPSRKPRTRRVAKPKRTRRVDDAPPVWINACGYTTAACLVDPESGERFIRFGWEHAREYRPAHKSAQTARYIHDINKPKSIDDGIAFLKAARKWIARGNKP